LPAKTDWPLWPARSWPGHRHGLSVPAEERSAQAALAAQAGLIRKQGVTLISIGNGTASRETEKRVADLLALLPGPAPKPFPMR